MTTYAIIQKGYGILGMSDESVEAAIEDANYWAGQKDAVNIESLESEHDAADGQLFVTTDPEVIEDYKE